MASTLHPPSLRLHTHYRLGKNLPGSGIFSRLSRSALRLQVTAITPTMAAPITAVLAFQLAGRAYQPPAGDQTSLGYLPSSSASSAQPIQPSIPAPARPQTTLTASSHRHPFCLCSQNRLDRLLVNCRRFSRSFARNRREPWSRDLVSATGLARCPGPVTGNFDFRPPKDRVCVFPPAFAASLPWCVWFLSGQSTGVIRFQ